MQLNRRPSLILLSTATLAALIILGIARYVVRPFPLAHVQSREQCRIFLDRNGDVIRVELAQDEQWRIPVPLNRIAPRLIEATVAVEDQRFFEHGGIDWTAVARAAIDNLRSGRIVSGASTITMQLGRLSTPNEPWGWPRKLRQTCRALHVEYIRDKNWILEQYLNLAPYGGNLVGCEAAARFYFGKPAAELTLAEATMLAGIPQNPVKLRPDRHPDAVRKRQQHVLQRMVEEGMIGTEDLHTARDADAVAAVVERRRRLGTQPGLDLPVEEPIFCRLAAEQCGAFVVQTTLDQKTQTLLRTALTEAANRFPDVADAAGVVIENQTGAVRALVGSLDFSEPRRGQVNAATAPRSPGSALKPFIYLLALEHGSILPQTMLNDEPLGYHEYRPGNFDGKFRGKVTATMALGQSLNTPAVRLLEAVGTRNLLDFLKKCGLRTLPDSDADCGLALALGGVETRLLELTDAYAVLARSGQRRPARFIDPPGKEPGESEPVARPDAVRLLRDMLNHRPLPGSMRPGVCWKTGTSSGFRDAWCFAFDSRHTVGIWLGNKSGASSPNLVGINAAAPVAAHIMNALATDPNTPAWPAHETDEHLVFQPVQACRRTGLRAGPYCRDVLQVQGLRNVTLNTCKDCALHTTKTHAQTENPNKTRANIPENCELRNSNQAPLIKCPSPTVYQAVNRHSVSLPCSAMNADETTEWFVNGEFVGRGAQLPRREFPVGPHTVTCSNPGGSARVEFQVVEAR